MMCIDNKIQLSLLSPVLGNVSSAQLRQWARGGAENRLERAVLAGQGRRLLAEALPLAHHLPTLVAKCDALHAAVERGSLAELQVVLVMRTSISSEVVLYREPDNGQAVAFRICKVFALFILFVRHQ